MSETLDGLDRGSTLQAEEMRWSLRADVLTQIEWPTGRRLVDLSRSDAEVVRSRSTWLTSSTAAWGEQVRRRRNDPFDVEVIGWQVYGDTAGWRGWRLT